MPVAASKAARAAAVRRAILSQFGVDLHADGDDAEQQQKSCFLAALLVMKMVQNDGKVHPIERFSFLCIGSVGAAYSLSELQSAGITHVVCAAASPRIRFPTHFKYLKLEGLRDQPTQDLMPHFEKAFEFIDDACASGGRVLVHCFKGVSRSAAVVCAYFIARKNMTLTEALDLVRAARPSVAPNQGFLRQLRTLEQQLRRDCGCEDEQHRPLSPSSEATTTSTSCSSSSSETSS